MVPPFSKRSKLSQQVGWVNRVSVNTLWGRVKPLKLPITQDELAQVLKFAQKQMGVAETTRFLSKEHGIPYALTLTPGGGLILSFGKKHKGGKVGSGESTRVYRALSLTEKGAEEIAEITVFRGIGEALDGWKLSREASHDKVVRHREAKVHYRHGKEKLALFAPLMKGNGDLLRGSRYTPSEKLKVLQDVAEGLARIHEMGLAHGNIRPAALLIEGEGVTLTGKVNGLSHTEGPEGQTYDLQCFARLIRESFEGQEIPKELKTLWSELAKKGDSLPSAAQVAERLQKIKVHK
ncbi:MAG: hypothetical protein AB7F31_07790 [Parachlamydiales bacterium]